MECRRIPLLVLLVGALAATGCAPEMPAERDEPVKRVEAMFDAERGIVPTPNDAAMDSDGTLPGLPESESGTAGGELSQYLSGLHGWPRSLNPEIPFSGRLDEETISEETVRMYRITGEGDFERAPIAGFEYGEVEEGRWAIELTPAEPFEAGAEYTVVVTGELEGENGEGVAMPVPIFLAASPEPLVDENGDATLDILADRDPETVQTLERMRQLLAPVFDALEAGIGDDDPVDRDDTAMVFRWTAMPEPAVSFYPDFGEVPLPNTAALDDDGTFPEQGVCPPQEEESAQAVFNDYLTDLSGWPAETPITVELTRPVDPESIGADDVQLWRQQDGEWVRLEDISVTVQDTEADPCTGEEIEKDYVHIEPPEPMSTHQNYFAFVTRDVEPAEGVDVADGEETPELLPELPMFLALQPHPLVDESGASTVSTLSDDQAAQLEELRQMVGSAMDVISQQQDLGYDDLAGVWSWFTWNDAFAVFDPESGRIPFPNSLLMSEDEETVQMPIPEGADEATQRLFEAVNRRAGFSTTARGWIPVDGELDVETLDFDSFQFLDQDEFSFLEDDDLTLYYDDESDRIVFEPKQPLSSGREFVGAISSDLKGANGRPVQPTPFFALFRSEYPVYADGESQVDVLDDETAQELEEARSEFNSQLPILGSVFFDDWGEEDGTDQYDIASVWTYRTDEPISPLQEYRAMVRQQIDQRAQATADRACEPGGCAPDDPDLIEPGDTYEHPNIPGTMVDTSNVAVFHEAGEFDTVAVDIEQHTVADGESVGISVYLPEEDQDGDSCTAPFEIAVTGHALLADRWQSGLALANDLAAYPGCMATVALDFPGHGGRTPGEAELHPESTPEATGSEFFTADIIETKQNLVQAIADLFALVRIIEGDGAESGLEPLFGDFGAGPYLDYEAPKSYVGLTNFGVPFAAMEPQVDTIAQSGSGGRYAWLLEGDEEGPSEIGETIFGLLEDEQGIAPGDDEFFQLMVMIQWLADHIDPFVFGETAADGGYQTLEYDAGADEFGPVTGDSCSLESDCPDNWQCETIAGSSVCVEHTPPVESLLQMIEGDRVVVNRCTEALAGQLGVDLEATTFQDVPHSFIAIVDESADEYTAAQCARQQAATWLETDGDLPDELSADQCLAQ